MAGRPTFLVAWVCVALGGETTNAFAQTDLRTSVVAGRVIDSESGEPVEGAEVGIDDGEIQSITNGDGEFRIEGVRDGRRVLWVRRIGYEERADTLTISDGAWLNVTVPLATQAVELEEILVEIQSPLLASRGFYQRQLQGYRGEFIDRVEILRRRPSVMSDLFRSMSGVQVVYGGIYGATVLMNQRVTFGDPRVTGCKPSIWVDGARSSMFSFDEVRIEEIEGLEVYKGATAPGKFNDLCGTVAIWTRMRMGGRH